MKNKRNIFYLLLFIILNFIIIELENNKIAFLGLERMFVPIINNKVIIIYLFFEYTFVFILISLICSSLYNYFSMYYFIKSRTNKNIIIIFIIKIYYRIILIQIMKFISDFLFCMNFNISRLYIFLKINILLLITSLLWVLLLTIFYLILQNQKKVLFISLSFVFINSYLSIFSKKFFLFSITSINFINDYFYIIFLKVLFIFLLIIIIMLLSKKIEIIGGKEYD